MERRPTYEELQANVRRMAERIAYLERLLWGGRRDKRVMQGPILFDAFFNEAAEAKEAAIASTVREIRKEAVKRRASAGPDVICMLDFRRMADGIPPRHGPYPVRHHRQGRGAHPAPQPGPCMGGVRGASRSEEERGK